MADIVADLIVTYPDMSMWNRDIHTDTENVHKCSYTYMRIGIWKHKIGPGTKLLFTFLSLRFFDMRRERHNFFLCWLFHLNPTTCGPQRKLLVWPRWALKVYSLVRGLNLNSTNVRVSHRPKLVLPWWAPKINLPHLSPKLN